MREAPFTLFGHGIEGLSGIWVGGDVRGTPPHLWISVTSSNIHRDHSQPTKAGGSPRLFSFRDVEEDVDSKCRVCANWKNHSKQIVSPIFQVFQRIESPRVISLRYSRFSTDIGKEPAGWSGSFLFGPSTPSGGDVWKGGQTGVKVAPLRDPFGKCRPRSWFHLSGYKPEE